MLDAIRKKVGTDSFKLKQLMPDQESGAALVSSVLGLDEIRAMMKEMEGASGTVGADYETSTDNFDTQKDILSSNIGQNIKDLAAPLLPYLTAASKFISQNMEKAREAPTKDPLATIPGGGMLQAGIKFLLRSTGSDGGKPSGLQRFLFGDAADPGFNLRQHLGVDLRPTADQSMQGYNDALSAEGDKAIAIAREKAMAIRDSLTFTATPTIQPNFVPPTPAPRPAAGGERHSSLINASPVKVANYFPGGNARLQASRAQREQNRSVRMAQARSLYDTGYPQA